MIEARDRTYEHIRYEGDETVGLVTMNRPNKRNALSLEHMQELISCLKAVGEAGETPVVVLRGAGPAFCAGHDLSEMVGRDPNFYRHLFDVCCELMQTIQAIPQVVIARVHALATAAGAQLVASCDLAIAADSAGIAAPGGKGGWFCHTPMVAIARNVGRKRAMEIALTGDVIDAVTATEWGLFNSAVPESDLEKATQELLNRATRGSRASKGFGKQALYAQLDRPERDAYTYAIEVMAAASQTPGAREGMAAFLEKRHPVWSD